jgi:hypothetical protein
VALPGISLGDLQLDEVSAKPIMENKTRKMNKSFFIFNPF